MPETSRSTHSTTTVTYRFTRDEVLEALCAAGLLPFNGERLDAQVYVRVPGGGDYSNINLDIDADCPLVVKVTETTES